MGDGYWSPTRCWGSPPVNGEWYGVKGFGCYFNSVWARIVPVTGRIYQHYMARGAECGHLGFPLGAEYRIQGGIVQYFIRPGSYDLLWVVAWDNGSTYDYVWPNYFLTV